MASIFRPSRASPEASETRESLDELCATATNAHVAGQCEAATRLYGVILRKSPQHPAANYGLGMLLVQSRQAARALAPLLAAIEAQPEIPDYWLGYLEALLLCGRTQEATATLEFGRRHGLAGAAVEHLAGRLLTLETAMLDEEHALLALMAGRDLAGAASLARRLTLMYPEHGSFWKIHGALLSTAGHQEDALAALRTAARLSPDDAEAHLNLGTALARSRQFADAQAHLSRARELKPDEPAAHYRLAMNDELQGRYPEALASLRRGRAIAAARPGQDPDDAVSFSQMLFLMSHDPAVDAERLFTEHRRYGDHFEAALRASWPRHRNRRSPHRVLKVGFVSGELYSHSVATFLEPIIERLRNRPSLELHAYCNNEHDDDVSRRLRGHFRRWTGIRPLADADIAARIEADGIDVLVDLAGHAGDTRLAVFAHKPAPIQVSWLGYPGTTGLTAMDYYLADRRWLPPGRFSGLFTEKLAYLPDRWAFRVTSELPAIGPLPALATGCLTFGSFHRLGKIDAASVAAWSRLLLAVPDARLLLAGMPQSELVAGLAARFAAHGIAPARLSVRGRCSTAEYLEIHNEVDIALDTLAYAGATTTMHSLAMGVPTLTIAGETAQSRAGAGILGNVGLDEFVASGVPDFVAKGASWAARLADLATLRGALRERLQGAPAGRCDDMAAHVETALRHMWQRWCRGLAPESFETASLAATGDA
jgi:predicted O-linked N-acetylglucosamine transferase (SPINDLY family)